VRLRMPFFEIPLDGAAHISGMAVIARSEATKQSTFARWIASLRSQ
jgi:hypothetical protein